MELCVDSSRQMRSNLQFNNIYGVCQGVKGTWPPECTPGPGVDFRQFRLQIRPTSNKPIFEKFSGLLGDVGTGPRAKNWENLIMGFCGRGWEKFLFNPHFWPPGGVGGPQNCTGWGT